MDHKDIAACVFARRCAAEFSAGVIPEPITEDAPRAYLRLEAVKPPAGGTIEQRRGRLVEWARCAQLVLARHAAAAREAQFRPEWVPDPVSTRAAAQVASEATAACAAAVEYYMRWGDAAATTTEQTEFLRQWTDGAADRARQAAERLDRLWQQAQEEAAARLAAERAADERRTATDPIWAAHTRQLDELYMPAAPTKVVAQAEAAEAALAALIDRTEQAARAAADRVRQRAAKRIAAAEARAAKAWATRNAEMGRTDEALRAAAAAERERVACELAPLLLAWRVSDGVVAVEDFDSAGRRAAVVTGRTDLFPHAQAAVEPLDADLPIIRGGFCGIDDPGHDAQWAGRTLGEIVTP